MADKQASREKEQTSHSQEITESHFDEKATESLCENESSEGNIDSPSQDSGTQDDKKKRGVKNLKHSKYLPLFGAALEGDWERAKRFFQDIDNPDNAVTEKITDLGETALHVAVTGGKATKFVKELVTKYPASLEPVDNKSNTALFYAAANGNTEVVRFLVEKDLSLAERRGLYNGYTPLHIAAKNGHKDTVDILLSKTIEKYPSIFEVTDKDKSGFNLLRNLITASLSGMALRILKRYPDLACNEDLQKFALEYLAEKPWLFESGTQLGCWKRLIYQWIEIPKKIVYSMDGDIKNSIDSPQDCSATSKDTFGIEIPKEIAYSNGGDIENSINSPKDSPATSKNMFGIMRGKVCDMFRNTIKLLVPSIYETKITQAQTLELVKLICEKMTFSQESEETPEPPEFLAKPLFRAIELGIPELVKKIITIYPPTAFFLDDVKRNIFQLAVLHRQEKVFSFIYDMGLHKHAVHFRDNQHNNILHLAARLQPSSQVSGPALQMQKELQWFKAVETLVPPISQKEKVKPSEGSKELTPRQLFTEEHAKLVEKGEKWMKDIAQSCSVVAALIVTMVFAAAFTAPGGYSSDGKPNFLHEPVFIIFSIADALALFFSTTSVLIFLGILTSRYSEEDFLESLPRKLIFAFITLFISIASMVVAFGAALHLVFAEIFKLVYVPIAALAGLPVILFAWLQFPLLVDIIRSTYGCGILRTVTRARTKAKGFFASCKKPNLTFCCKDV